MSKKPRTTDNGTIARTLATARKLGQEAARAPRTEMADGLTFSRTGWRPGALCFVGPCDPGTGNRLVGYYDTNGNCNEFVKVSC